MATLDSLKLYKQLFEKLPVSIFVADIQTGKIVDANEQACKLINRPYEEVITLHQSQLHPEEFKDNIEENFSRHIESLLNDESIESLEFVICDSNNNHIPVEISPTLVEVEGKKLIVGLFKDLRKRKKRENLIAYYDKALEKASSFLALIDKNYKYLSVNNYYAKVFGITKEEMLGKTIGEVLGDEYFLNTVKTRIDEAFDGKSIEFETTLELKGKKIYLQVYYEPYYSSENKVEAVILHVYDTTKFKEYEDENTKKEKLLVQQSKMAAMGEMLENIAHQWRQPLSVISTCTSGIMLQKEFNTLTDDVLNDSLKNIMNTTSYLSSTIDDFKNFFERDKDKVEFNVSDLLNKTLDLVEMSFSSNDIELIKNFDTQVEVYNYKNELMQVVLNIVNNAKDALLVNNKGLEKRKLIKVSLFKEEDNTIIEILDNAGGIPSNIIMKIFEPYFTTKHQSQGTGIGLFMTQEIVVKHMEGEISVKNENYEIDKESFTGALFRIVI